MTYKYTICQAPITKKNSQVIATNRTGRPFILPSQAYRDFEDAAAWYLRPMPREPIDYPVNVKCIFYMPTRRRVDKTNLEEAIHDTLVKCRILADDNRDIIASTDGSRVYYDKEHPRVEIEITPYAGEYELFGKQEKAGEQKGKQKKAGGSKNESET